MFRRSAHLYDLWRTLPVRTTRPKHVRSIVSSSSQSPMPASSLTLLAGRVAISLLSVIDTRSSGST